MKSFETNKATVFAEEDSFEEGCLFKMKDFYNWMKTKEEYRNDDFRIIKAITCQDGFTMSVQCSRANYCSPRIITAIENYGTFEVGFPSDTEGLMMKYAEKPGNPTETVYSQVPLKVVLAVIEKHGGILW